MLARFFAAFLLLIFLNGCGFGYRINQKTPPEAALNNAVQNSSLPLVQTSCLPGNWWTIFDDSQLSLLIEKTLILNPNIQIAKANIDLAKAQANFVQAALYPSLTWAGDISRQKLSETGLIPFQATKQTAANTPLVAPTKGGFIPVYFTQYETEAILSYDFDLWGKNRNTLKAAVGEIYTELADEAFVRLQLSVAVARTYYQLQTDLKRYEIASALLQNRQNYVDLIKQRVEANLDDLLSLRQAELEWNSIQQTALDIALSIEIDTNKLRAYLADEFEEMIDPVNSQLPIVPLPCDLPLHLLVNRPDIISQLWIIESAGREIEVAKAGFYPDFNIVALFGFQTIHLHKLFEWPSTFFNVDPAFNLPIFDGGKLAANLQGSEVNYNLAILEYNKLVINATQEVLDAIAKVKNSEQQLRTIKERVALQSDLLDLITLRMNNNLSSVQDVLNQEQQQLISMDQEISTQGRQIQATLDLIKALGGGFTSFCKEECIDG